MRKRVLQEKKLFAANVDRESEIQPIRNMMAAIVHRALLDLELPSTNQEDRRNAEAWIFSSDSAEREEPYTLAWVCDQLFEGDGRWFHKVIEQTAKEILCGARKRKNRKAIELAFEITLPFGSTSKRSRLQAVR